MKPKLKCNAGLKRCCGGKHDQDICSDCGVFCKGLDPLEQEYKGTTFVGQGAAALIDLQPYKGEPACSFKELWERNRYWHDVQKSCPTCYPIHDKNLPPGWAKTFDERLEQAIRLPSDYFAMGGLREMVKNLLVVERMETITGILAHLETHRGKSFQEAISQIQFLRFNYLNKTPMKKTRLQFPLRDALSDDSLPLTMARHPKGFWKMLKKKLPGLYKKL